jgi:hypothetical protein
MEKTIEATPTTRAEAAAVEANPVTPAIERSEVLGLLLRSRPKPFKLTDFEGRRYAIVAPTAAERARILNDSIQVTIDPSSGKPMGGVRTDTTRMQVLALRFMLYTVAATDGGELQPGVPVFDDVHVPLLLDTPSGSIVESLGDTCCAWMNQQDRAAREAAKNA